MKNRKAKVLRAPVKLFEELTKHSRKNGFSVNALILIILWDWVREKSQKSETIKF